MNVNISREDIWIFRRYLEERGERIPDSIPNQHVVRRMAKTIGAQLKDPPIMAPDLRNTDD